MSKNVTMITLSKEEFVPAQIPDNCEYVNHVSVFQNHQDAVEQMLLAISKVETPYYFFGDYDDPAPKLVPTPSKKNGILYGDMFIQTGSKVVRRKIPSWEANAHLCNPFFIHKAVCRTDYTLLLATLLPTEKVWFEYLYHFFLADCFGWEYNQDYQYIWNKNTTGMHTTLPPLTTSTTLWIRENRDRIKAMLKK